MTSNTVFTIGHSTLEFSSFLALLQQHDVTAVADVRSVPASRFAPHFNQNTLKRSLWRSHIKYVFLGDELGARTSDATCYVDGRVQYGRLARTSQFAIGIDRLLKGSTTERIAIMCSEREPLDCHRTVLIARVIADHEVDLEHIHSDGRTESHASAMHRLMAMFNLAEADLLYTAAERLEQALSRQEHRIAYFDEELASTGG